MKIRRLSEIDLARFAAHRSQEILEHALRAYNTGGGTWSYDPVRASTSDILGAATPLPLMLPPPPWAKIKRQIEASSRRGAQQASANCTVGKVLYDYARDNDWKAVKFPMGRMPIGSGESVQFWCDVVLEDKDGIFIPFFDHRRANGISNSSNSQIVYSIQNMWARERFPDLSGARLAIIRFPSQGDDRSIRIDFHTEKCLLEFDEIDQRVRNVYETWRRISEEKSREYRKTGTDSDLFG